MQPASNIPLSHVFITGAYRSGTTLLHHLLDGHPDLTVFPVENCLFRDYLFAYDLPHARARSLRHLEPLMVRRNIDGITAAILRNDKLDLPLHERLFLSGSLGDQVLHRHFDRDRFVRVFRDFLANLPSEREFTLRNLFDAYHVAYAAARGDDGSSSRRYLVNKCPEKGCCIDVYLSTFEDARIVHMVRDPRAVIASHKAGLPRAALFPYRRFFHHVEIVNAALRACAKFERDPRVLSVKYEDLISDTRAQMNRITEFLDVAFSENLLRPTILGEDWVSNSSFSVQRRATTAIHSSSISQFVDKLNQMELAYVESVCAEAMARMGYQRQSPDLDMAGFRRRYALQSILDWRTHWFRARRKASRLFAKATARYAAAR